MDNQPAAANVPEGTQYVQPADAQKVNYYANKPRSKKTIDFILGFFAGVAFIVADILVFAIIGVLFPANQDVISGSIQGLVVLVSGIFLLINIVSIVFAFRSGRNYIGLGLIAVFLFGVIVLPLLFFGACLLMIAGVGG